MNHLKMINKTYLKVEIFQRAKGMDLLQILEKFEKLEHIDFKPNNRLRLTEKDTVLPWKKNYWQEKLLQDRPYHKRLLKSRKKVNQDVEERIKERIRMVKK